MHICCKWSMLRLPKCGRLHISGSVCTYTRAKVPVVVVLVVVADGVYA